MSLRRRLFLLLGGLISVLLVGQWLLFRALSRAVTDDVRTVAFRVGEEILSGFSYRTESLPGEAPAGDAPADAGTGTETGTETHVVVVTSRARGEARGLAAEEAPAPGESATPATVAQPATGEPQRIVLRRELHLGSPGEAMGTGEGGPGSAASAPGGEAEGGSLAPSLPGRELRKIVLETDAARDVLVVGGPQMKRRIPIPHAEVTSTLDRFGSQLLLGNLALLAVGLLAVAVVAHRLTRPLASLSAAAERLGGGELGAVAEDPRRSLGDGGERGHPSQRSGRDDEIGRTIASFNRMSQRLADLDRENRRLAAAEQLSELGEVARGLAHSLRNPLNALGLAIEQLGARAADGGERGSPESAAPAEVVEGSRRQIRRMDGALRSFLALASAGSAQPEPVDLAQLAREVALEALQDGGGRVRIDVRVAPALGVVAPGTAPGAARPAAWPAWLWLRACQRS